MEIRNRISTYLDKYSLIVRTGDKISIQKAKKEFTNFLDKIDPEMNDLGIDDILLDINENEDKENMEEVLNRPYFQAKVFILSISVIFFYVSIIVTLFLADFIVNPVLFLCGNIRRTANSLGDMLAGNAKIESGKLIFEETVHTNDEIKNLSVEIKNIVSLVRGMLPYVSFHTVQNAEKKAGRLSTTRELCFLFTDIRGFTSLCEKVPPKEIIRLLNHYLDIETKIILIHKEVWKCW